MRNVTVQQTAKVFDDDGLSVSSNDSGYIDKSNSASSVYSEAASSKYNNGGVTYSSYQNFLEAYGKKQFSTVQPPKGNVKSEIFIKINNDQTDHAPLMVTMNGTGRSPGSKVCEQFDSTPMSLNEKIQKFNIGEKSKPVKVKNSVLVATVHEQNKPVSVEKGPIDFKIVLANPPSPKTSTSVLQKTPSFSGKPSLPPTKPNCLSNKLTSPKPQSLKSPPPKVTNTPQPMTTTIISPIQYVSVPPPPPPLFLSSATDVSIPPPPPKLPQYNSAPSPPKLPQYNSAPSPPKLPEFSAAPQPPKLPDFTRKCLTSTIQPSPIRKLSNADHLSAAKSSVIDEIKRRVEGTSPPLKNAGQPYVPQNSYGFTRSFANEPRNNYNTLPKGWKTKPDETKSYVTGRSSSFNNKNASTALNNVSVRPNNILNGSTNNSVQLSNKEADITTKVAMFEEKPITKDDPNVKKLVYSTYRNLLGAYNNKANSFVATLPRNMVIEDKGVTQQLNSIALQGGLDHLNGRTKEPSDN